MSSIKPFVAPAYDEAISDLKRRLDAVRWPDPETVGDWSQGVPLATMKTIVDHWRHRHDWSKCAAWIEGAGQFVTNIDGVDIHFLHIRSPHADAMPLLMTHGWPGAMLEFRHVVDPLARPEGHGGQAADAFHLVLPSLPGYGFSGKPTEKGWSVQKIAAAWAELMRRLGYDRYVAQGGDWGSAVTTDLGVLAPEGLAGIHVNMPIVLPANLDGPHSEAELQMLADLGLYQEEQSGYSTQQSTRPQTVGYALADSPVGQAAWIYEKFAAWSDCGGDPTSVIALDDLLDIITLYWLTNSGASSGRLYWESYKNGFNARHLKIPVGCSVFPKELYRAPRSWADRCMDKIIHWNELPKGGHFAAMEQPAMFIDEVRNCFRVLR